MFEPDEDSYDVERREGYDIPVPKGMPREMRERFILNRVRLNQEIDAYNANIRSRCNEMIDDSKNNISFQRGIIYGTSLGIVGNFLVTFSFDILKSINTTGNFDITSLVGLIVTLLVTGYVIRRSFKDINKAASDRKLAELRQFTLDRPHEYDF